MRSQDFHRDFHRLKLLCLGLCIGLNGCGIGGPLREDKPAQGYEMGQLPKPKWIAPKENASGADAVFENAQDQSIIALHSVCDRYPNATLESLMNQLLEPLSNREVLEQKKSSIDDRDSLWTRVKAKLDGVAVESHLVVYRKNNCIFDFQIHARGELSEADEKDFKQFVEGFHYRGGR